MLACQAWVLTCSTSLTRSRRVFIACIDSYFTLLLQHRLVMFSLNVHQCCLCACTVLGSPLHLEGSFMIYYFCHFACFTEKHNFLIYLINNVYLPLLKNLVLSIYVIVYVLLDTENDFCRKWTVLSRSDKSNCQVWILMHVISLFPVWWRHLLRA